jgi:hypothetical protein
MKNKNKKNNEVRSVGRPAATINYPNRKFTLTDLAAENTHVTKLCLIKHLEKDKLLNKKSLIVRLGKDEKRASASGKGAKQWVYQKRSRQGIGSVTHSKAIVVEAVKIETPTATPTPTVEPPISANYEAQKAALLGTATHEPVVA